MAMLTQRVYDALLTAMDTLLFATSTVFLVLLLYSKFKSKLVRIRTVTLYIFFYGFAALVAVLDDLADCYDLLPHPGNTHDALDVVTSAGYTVSHQLFFILMIERLYMSFSDTVYSLTASRIIALLTISVCIQVLHIALYMLIEFEVWNETLYIPLWIIFLILSNLFGLLLTIIFARKLFAVIVSNRQSLQYSDTFLSMSPSSQENEVSRMSLSARQKSLVQAVTRIVFLSICAILFRMANVVLFGIVSIMQHQELHHTESANARTYSHIIACYVGMNVCMAMELLCVYLSYTYFTASNWCYERLCGKLQNRVRRCLEKCARENITRTHMDAVRHYTLMTDTTTDDESL